MTYPLLDEYARLLTTDTRACSELFSNDAEFRTQLGTNQLSFLGREEIARFLRHVPRQISFRVAHCAREGEGFRGALHLVAADLRPRQQVVRYWIAHGRFTRFEVLPGPEASTLRAS